MEVWECEPYLHSTDDWPKSPKPVCYLISELKPMWLVSNSLSVVSPIQIIVVVLSYPLFRAVHILSYLQAQLQFEEMFLYISHASPLNTPRSVLLCEAGSPSEQDCIIGHLCWAISLFDQIGLHIPEQSRLHQSPPPFRTTCTKSALKICVRVRAAYMST